MNPQQPSDAPLDPASGRAHPHARQLFPHEQALGRVPSGLFILTARHGETETGMLASWIMQAGFEPPMLTVAVRRDRYVAEWLMAGSPFVVNMLAEGHKKLLRHFRHGFEPGEQAFHGLELRRSELGVAILPEILGHLECRPLRHVESGDHFVFLAQVVGGSLETSEHPMVHVRKSGANY